MVAQPVVACVSFHLQRTSSLSTCDHTLEVPHAASVTTEWHGDSKNSFYHVSLMRPLWWPPFRRASSSVGAAAVNCCKRSRHTGSGARLECLRHITRDEAQLQARQPAASSQGAGPKRQRLEVQAHAAALRGLCKSSKPRLRQSGGTSGGYLQPDSRHLINLYEHEDQG